MKYGYEWNGPNDSRVSWQENCFECAFCRLRIPEDSDLCMIDKHEIKYTEDSVCLLFLNDWDGTPIGQHKDSNVRIIDGRIWTKEIFDSMHAHYDKWGYD